MLGGWRLRDRAAYLSCLCTRGFEGRVKGGGRGEGILERAQIINISLEKPRNRFEVAEAQLGHCFSSRSDDDTSKYRRFGIMLVADPDYVLALYPYPYHTIRATYQSAGGDIGICQAMRYIYFYYCMLGYYCSMRSVSARRG